MFFEAGNGKFDISVCDDPDYPGIDVEYISNENNGKLKEGQLSRPRVLFETPNSYSDNLRVLVWADQNSEDYSEEIIFNTKVSTAPEIIGVKVTKRLVATNIKWDVEEENDGNETIDLPNSILIPLRVSRLNDDEAISDYLSEFTGFCHKGFELITIEEEI